MFHFIQDYQGDGGREKPDVVHVCLPQYLHVGQYLEGTARLKGCNVFCETGGARYTRQGQEFVEFEAAHPDVHIGIYLQNRFNESSGDVKRDIIDSPVSTAK